jgi:hypothetical protein
LAALTTPFALAATDGFLAGAAFLVTPTGLPALGTAFVLREAAGLVRLMVGPVSTLVKTRGLEWPVCERVPSRAMAGDDRWGCGLRERERINERRYWCGAAELTTTGGEVGCYLWYEIDEETAARAMASFNG